MSAPRSPAGIPRSGCSTIAAAPEESSTPIFRNATRIQTSLTSSVERRALLWLAARVPSRVNSDHLTILGAASMFLAGGSYAFARWNSAGWLLATLFLALNWLGDSLDGTVARVRNCQRPRYGFYVDHIVDSFGAIFLISGLALSGHMDWRIAAAMLIAFLLLSIETYLATYVLGTFRLSFVLFGPTELRLLLAAANIATWVNPDARTGFLGLRLFDLGGLAGACGMLIMATVATVYHTRQLYQDEKLR